VNEFVKMMNEYGATLICAAVFVCGSLWLIKYLLKQVNSLGERIGALEMEYRNDLKRLIEQTTERVGQSNDLHRDVIAELRACRDRHVTLEGRKQ